MIDISRYLTNVGATLFWAALGIIILLVADKVFELVDSSDLKGQVGKGNVAAAVVEAGLLLGTAIIVAASLLPSTFTIIPGR